MKGRRHIENWASGVLGAVSLLLLMNLVLHFSGVRAGASRATVPAAGSPGAQRPQAVSLRGSDELSRYDPVVRLDVLKELQARPLPQLTRNPFEFEASRPGARKAEAKDSPAPASPAGPPAPPLRAVGYTERLGGVREAYITDEEQIYVVHEGEVFAKNFRVLKISATQIEIEDESSRQTVRLPINP